MIEAQLIALAQKDDLKAKELLFKGHRGWIRTLAGNHWNSKSQRTRLTKDWQRSIDTEIEDIFQEGVLAWLDCLHRYRLGGKAALKTFAYRRVKGAISNLRKKERKLIPVSPVPVSDGMSPPIESPMNHHFGVRRVDVPANVDGDPDTFGKGGIWTNCTEREAKRRAGISAWSQKAAAQAKILDGAFKKDNGYLKDWSLDRAVQELDRRALNRLQAMGRRAYADWLVARETTCPSPKKEPFAPFRSKIADRYRQRHKSIQHIHAMDEIVRLHSHLKPQLRKKAA